MKKMYLFIAGVVFASCVSDNLEKSSLSETTISSVESSYTDKNELDKLKLVALTGDTKISIEEAKELALYTANQMREVEGIVTKAPLRIKDVEVIKNGIKKEYIKTKAGKEEQSDLYLLNFENNQGYVLTSADRRISGVFAYSSTGNLGDTVYNPGKNILLERVMYYMEQKKAEFDKNRSKLVVSGQEDLFKKLSKERQQDLIKDGLFDEKGKRIVTKRAPIDCWSLMRNSDHRTRPSYENGSWKIIYKKAPLVKTLWSQSGLYNDKVKKNCSGGDQAPVGAVAIAVGQIMGYHKKPSYFSGEQMNWNHMTRINSGDMFSEIYSCIRDGKSDIQHLLAELGDRQYLNMRYDCGKGSYASSASAVKAFRESEYNTATLQDYNSDKVVSEIKNNRPVYISGACFKTIDRYTTGWWIFKKHHTRTTYSSIHAWLLDGYVKRSRKVTTISENIFCKRNEPCDAFVSATHNQNLELVHNNFGWGGIVSGRYIYKATGWYHKDLFNANIGPIEPSGTYKSGQALNFQYYNKIITNIK